MELEEQAGFTAMVRASRIPKVVGAPDTRNQHKERAVEVL
jgi:hypothetical protein